MIAISITLSSQGKGEKDDFIVHKEYRVQNAHGHFMTTKTGKIISLK